MFLFSWIWVSIFQDESSTLELNSIKDVIKCVEDHKLESDFRLDKLKKRATYLEKSKAERKKTSSSVSKPRKRGCRGSGSSSSRPAKSAKTNSYPSSSFSRRNLAPPLQPSPSARFSGGFNYPTQTLLESSAANPYAPATYGTPHTESPAGITQQHYSLNPVDNLGLSGYRSSGSYATQTSYGIYDYGNAAPPAYQPPPYSLDQTSYRGWVFFFPLATIFCRLSPFGATFI